MLLVAGDKRIHTSRALDPGKKLNAQEESLEDQAETTGVVSTPKIDADDPKFGISVPHPAGVQHDASSQVKSAEMLPQSFEGQGNGSGSASSSSQKTGLAGDEALMCTGDLSKKEVMKRPRQSARKTNTRRGSSRPRTRRRQIKITASELDDQIERSFAIFSSSVFTFSKL